MKSRYLLILLPFIAGCSDSTGEPDAWGNFEATEVIISSESSGRIVTIPSTEGDIVKAGDLAAITDTTMLLLQRDELKATKAGINSRLKLIDAQNEILFQQIRNLDINIERVRNMIRENAATQKQLDDLTGQVDVIKKQIQANNSQKESVRSEMGVIESKDALIREQLSKCYLKFPASGTILTSYSEPGEITGPGKPLFKIADLNVMKLKVFISGDQLSSVKIGEKCTVMIDGPDNTLRKYTGKVSRVSDKAEFTPKIIQTREERVDLVYAVIIDVENDGAIKSGMPGEVIFSVTIEGE